MASLRVYCALMHGRWYLSILLIVNHGRWIIHRRVRASHAIASSTRVVVRGLRSFINSARNTGFLLSCPHNSRYLHSLIRNRSRTPATSPWPSSAMIIEKKREILCRVNSHNASVWAYTSRRSVSGESARRKSLNSYFLSSGPGRNFCVLRLTSHQHTFMWILSVGPQKKLKTNFVFHLSQPMGSNETLFCCQMMIAF